MRSRLCRLAGAGARQRSNGEHEKSGGISKRGNHHALTMLVKGAQSVCLRVERAAHDDNPLYRKTRHIARSSIDETFSLSLNSDDLYGSNPAQQITGQTKVEEITP